ncbi:MAG: winged helix-turn-helix domain-containing protein [Chloroflexota bacterium]
MALVYKEAGFPVDYRAAEVEQIMGAIYRLRSIAVTGLAGMGKSNLIRFIVSQPQVRPRYLKERANDYIFVHVDCTGLLDSSEAEILNEIAGQLGYNDPLADEVRLPPVSRSLRRILKTQILNLGPYLNLVVALDNFDEAAARLDKSFFNYLFHLRNSRPRANVAYIFTTRRPMGPLYELQELLDDACFIGPLNEQDALASIGRDEARLNRAFDRRQRDKLLAWTGRHPGFLKNATELLGSRKIDASQPEDEIVQHLLASEKIRGLGEELWRDLTPAEQGILLNIAGGLPVSEAVEIEYLERSGLLIRKNVKRAGPAIFCPLFEAFIRQNTPAVSGMVRITASLPNQAQIKTPLGQEIVTLPPKVFALLLVLTEARGEVVTIDEIINHIYGAEAVGVTNAALSQLVKRLRSLLDHYIQRLINDPTYTCVETVRDVGYRLNS